MSGRREQARRRAGVAGVALACLLAVAMAAAVGPATAADPLRGGSPAPETARPSEPPGLATQAWFAFQKLQRETQQRIQRHMSAIAKDDSAAALLVGMGLAFLYGVLHTAGPGHGKMVVASYFLGHDARPWRGMLMGLRIAVTHVIAAVVLVGVADITVRNLLGGAPDEVRWLQLASYGTIAAIGGFMLVRAVRRLKQGEAAAFHHHDHAAQGRDHAHDHDGKQQGLLAAAAGLAPCTGALLIMLYAFANGIVLSGILLVACISLGMAMTVALIGVICIVARRWMVAAVARQGHGRSWFFGGLELAGAIAIAGLGAAMLVATVQAG